MNDEALWTAFTSQTLPTSEWTHRAHLRVAWMHLKRFGLDEAHVLMRVGIIRLNAAQGLVETKDRGYHETLTRVWLVLVGARLDDAADSETFVDRHQAAFTREAVMSFYSKEHVMSLRARAMFVAPDLHPLPA